MSSSPHRSSAGKAFSSKPRAPKTPDPVAPPPGPLPTQHSPETYEQQLASMLSPGSTLPAPIQGQFPLPQYQPLQQPGFGNQGFNPNMGLFGSFAPSQGGMFSGLFGGQQ